MNENVVYLPFSVVIKVLAQNDSGFIIDLLKLFTNLWNENPEIQKSRELKIKDHWTGLARMVEERYKIQINEEDKQKIIDSFKSLESLTWGTSWENKKKLLTFSGLKNEELIITYLSGFYKPLADPKRLVTVLKHPKVHGELRSIYNRLALAISLCFSLEYKACDEGILMDDAAYEYFKEVVGFKCKCEVQKAIEAFTKTSCFFTLNDGRLELGRNNKFAKNLILRREES